MMIEPPKMITAEDWRKHMKSSPVPNYDRRLRRDETPSSLNRPMAPATPAAPAKAPDPATDAPAD